jgi:S-DNA-T family DNA segregation ATPase FtsK/SpoIIIE
MTTPNHGAGDNFDWAAAEADVVDLNAARHRRGNPPRPGDTADDTAATPATAADDTDDGGALLVDSAAAQRRPRLTLAALRGAERRPIVPPWLRSRAEFVGNLAYATGLAGHSLGYHLVRLPKYAVKLLVRAPRGFGRVCVGYHRWLWDMEGEPVRQAIVRAAIDRPDEAKMYDRLSTKRDRRVRWRGLVTIGLAAGLLLAVGALLVAATWVQWSVLAAVVAVLGVVGSPADKPLLDTAVVTAPVPPLTSDIVLRALSVMGIAGINQAIRRDGPKAIAFPAPIARDGKGWRAEVDLPPGVTASDVIEDRARLASGLSRPLGCVWPEGRPDVHPGRLVVWVGDQDMATSKPAPWPLLKASTFNLGKAFPFGTDPRGRPVMIELPYTNVLIGSIPGYGKTAATQLPLVVAALDPYAEIWAFDFKGTGGLDPIERVCARYASGQDDETAEAGLIALRELRKECAKRAATIKRLPKHVCPDNKVTAELARRKGLGLHWLVVALDEVQELFSHPEFGKEASELAEKIIKLGRALGVILIIATQRPDAKSLPTGVSANAGTRLCLRVMGQLENDMILGTSAYKNGVRATMFTKRDLGLGYLVGSADDAQITKTYYLNGPTVEAIITRAHAAREAAGTLTGHAAGKAPETPAVRRDTLLDDVLAVIPAADAKVWTDTVVDRLTELRPEAYADLTRDQLTAALKPYGIATGQVWGTDPATGKGANRRGIDRQHITDAIAERDRRRRAG